jgi:signal recognition particle receptor subunit beta
MVIFDKLDPKQKGKMLSLATKTDRTLFFDLLPVDIGKVGAFNLKIQLYTVPGQVFYNETRKLVLKGADGVVFVSDSQPSMVDSTRESFANLMENLEENNIDPNDTPIVIQFNKRDLPGVLSIEELQEALGFEGYPYIEAAAINGEGVMETFHLVSKITAKHLYARLQGKPVPLEKEKAKPAAASKAETKPEPEPEPAPQINPFADSIPFPESQMDSSYERMEEVSLEQLLSEGRERPATLSGDVAVPVIDDAVDEAVDDALDDAVDDVEELHAAELLPADETAAAVAVLHEPEPAAGDGDGRVASLEQQVQSLESQLDSLRAGHRAEIEEILRGLESLTSNLRRRLDE